MSASEPVILVADDDPSARAVMRAALRRAGYTVLLAEGGHDALRQFAEHACDMVMLDIDMPDLSGLEVCERLRALAGPNLPIVMVTGMDHGDAVQTAYDRGATDFISKPVNWALVGHRVRYLFRTVQVVQELASTEASHAALLGALPDPLLEWDLEGRCLGYRGPRTGTVADWVRPLLSQGLRETLTPDMAAVCLNAIQLAFATGHSGGHRVRWCVGEHARWFDVSVSAVATAPLASPRFVALWRDVTDQQEAQDHVRRLAYLDGLTGLPNRHAFMDRVDREIERARAQGRQLAVLFMDLDGFKTINDTMGHAAGDLLLQWAAKRLSDGLRGGDVLARSAANAQVDVDTSEGGEAAKPAGDATANATEMHAESPQDLARLGGDEFTALIGPIDRPEDALHVANRMAQALRRPFPLQDREVNISVSIGVAIFPHDGQDAGTLLKHADTAMYHAKDKGRDNAQLYNESLTLDIMRRVDMQTALQHAVEHNGFTLAYQPQVSAANGRVSLVEALIRWRVPGKGEIAPLDFIPLCEETGLIEQVGLWVLRTACADAATWHRAGHPLTVAVNLSPVQLHAAGFVQQVKRALADAGLPPQYLELEVTEGVLMEHTPRTRSALQTLRDLGVMIALDDFGTGYSSLSYLTRMPITHIKVDRGFIAGLLEGGDNEAIVHAVLALASSLGKTCTAEGVENLQQALALKAMSCDYLQGYYFSRPVPAADIPALAKRTWDLDISQAESPWRSTSPSEASRHLAVVDPA